MNGAEWTALAVAAIGAIGAIVLQALQMYLSYKRDTSIEGKVDENTKITTNSSEVADKNSRAAVETAMSAATNTADIKEVTESIKRKLNGGIDSAISDAVRPINDKLVTYSEMNDKNVRDMNDKIVKLNEYVRTRNHDMLTALQTLSNQVGAVILKIEENSKTAK